MGLSVTLITSDGEVVEEPVHDVTNVLGQILPTPEDAGYYFLPYIDPYGDTIFNGLQMRPFLAEWTRIQHENPEAAGSPIVQAVERLARTCGSESHLYLKFVGD